MFGWGGVAVLVLVVFVLQNLAENIYELDVVQVITVSMQRYILVHVNSNVTTVHSTGRTRVQLCSLYRYIYTRTVGDLYSVRLYVRAVALSTVLSTCTIQFL